LVKQKVSRLKRPWLFLPPEWAHNLSPFFLNTFYGRKPKKNSKFEWNAMTWEGLTFRNPVGTAGGVDKNAINIKPWWNLGAGFLELGTVTPLPQAANPGKIVDRDLNLEAVWNCLGFPNLGVKAFKKNLQNFPKEKRITPLFLNIGKNRSTENKDAHQDYIYLIEQLHEDADAFVVNISSPNTKGLRALFSQENFKNFIEPICNSWTRLQAKAPLLLKLSPDLERQELENLISVTEHLPIKGWILNNTTQGRSVGMKFDADKGGVSGRPLAQKSEKLLIDFQNLLGSRRSKNLIISTGGLFDLTDVSKRLELGADLTQVYSSLIFQGPYFFKKLSKAQKRKAL
jgi:dihydroorotate dehydrogenase